MKRIFVLLLVVTTAAMVGCGQTETAEETAEPAAAEEASMADAGGEVSEAEGDAFVEAKNNFHDILSPIWHEAYEEKDMERISEAADEFVVRAEAVVAAAEGKSEEEVAAAEAVLEAAKTLKASIEEEKSEEEILANVETLHEAYHSLQEM
jgi:hypothetical protein